MVNTVLLVERGDRLSAGDLAARGTHGLVSEVEGFGAENGFDEIAAIVDFSDDAIGFVVFVGADDCAGGIVRTGFE